MESSYRKPQNLKEGTQTNKTVKSRVTLNSTYVNNLSQQPTKDIQEDSVFYHDKNDRKNQIAVFTNSSVLDSKESNGSKSQLHKSDFQKNTADSRNTFADIRASSQQGFQKKYIEDAGFVPNFANFHEFHNMGMHQINHKCNQSMNFPPTNQTPLTGFGGSIHESKDFGSSEHSYPKYYYQREPNGPKELQSFIDRKMHHRVKTNQMGRSHKISDVLAWMNHGTNKKNATGSDWVTNQQEINQFSNRLNVIDSRHQKAKSVMGKIYPGDRPYQDDHQSEFQKNSYFGQNRYSQADPSEQDLGQQKYFDKFKYEELSRIKFRKDMQRSLELNLKKKRKWQFQQYLNEQNSKLMNNSMSLKQSFKGNESQLSFTSEINSLKRATTNHADNRKGKSRLSNLSNISNLKNLQDIKKIMNQGTKMAELSSNQVRNEPKPEYINYGPHKHRLNSVQEFNPMELTNTNQKNLTNFEIDQKKNRYPQSQYSDNLNTYNELLSKEIEQANVSHKPFDSMQISEHKKAQKQIQKDTIGSRNQSTNVIKGTLEPSDLQMFSMNQALAPDFKIYKKTSKFEPKKTKSLIVHHMQETNKNKLAKYKNSPEKGLSDKNLSQGSPNQEQYVVRKNVMIDSEGSEVESFDSGRNFTVLNRQELKIEAIQSSSPGKKDLNVDTAKKDFKVETASPSPMRFSESTKQEDKNTIVSNNENIKEFCSPNVSKSGSFKITRHQAQLKLQEKSHTSPVKPSEVLTDIDPLMLQQPLKSSEKHLQEQFMNSTDLAVSHAVLQTKYQINPLDHEGLYKILDQNTQNRREYLEKFIENIMKTLPIENREAFKIDLVKYLIKQRQLLNIQNQLEHNIWVQKQMQEKAEAASMSGVHDGKDGKRQDKILKKKQKEKKKDQQVDFDQIKCPIHEKILNFAEQKDNLDIYLPNCCKVDKNNALCFDEYKDETPPEGQNKVIWFKEGGYDQYFKEHYQDVDEKFLANMESFLKFQFKGIQDQKSKKIKALDVVLNLMKKKNEQNSIKYDPANQKLAQDYHEKSVFDVDQDLVPMNILQLGEDNLINLKTVPPQYRKMLTQGVRIKNEKKVLDGMNQLMTMNVGLLMGSSVAKEIDESKVQVDVRQLYMPNINNSQLITNKMIVKELLPGKDFNSNKLVLGRSMQDRHDKDITQLLGLQPQKQPDLLMNVISASLKKAKNVSQQKQQSQEQQSEVVPPPEDPQVKTKDFFEKSKLKAGKAVQKMMEKKYERDHQERLVQQRLKQNLDEQDSFYWKDIDLQSQNIIALICKEHNKVQQEFCVKEDYEKYAFADSRNFHQDMKAEQDSKERKVAKDQFMKIIMDLLTDYIDEINLEMNRLPSVTPASPGLSEDGHGHNHGDEKSGLHHANTVGNKAQVFGHFKNLCQHEALEMDTHANSEQIGQKQSIYNVFNKYTNQKQFFRDIKTNPNSFLKDTETKNFEFHQKCHEGMCMSVPTFSHMIKGTQIHINSYRMDIPLVDAFVKHVNETNFTPDNRRNIESVVINDCGFADLQVSYLLKFLSHPMSDPKLASVTKDEVGSQAVDKLCKAINKGLQKLVIDQVKIPEKNHLPKLFQQLETQSSLRYLSIVSVNLASNPHVFESLLLYLKNPQSLVGLKLQNNNFKSRHILKITENLIESRELQDCDLCSNKLCRKEKEMNQLILKNLAMFVYNDAKLRHLSLQGMHLGLALEVETALVKSQGQDNQATKKDTKKGKAKKEKTKAKEPAETKKPDDDEMPENAFESLIEVLAESHSLQVVHLSNNGFTEEQVSYIQNKFGIRLDNTAQSSKERTKQLEKLRNMYLTFEVQNNQKLTDHAKIINNELLNQLNETKQMQKENKLVDPSLIDIFHDNLIFQRKIGHSELVFTCQEHFMGGLEKEFSKKWRHDIKNYSQYVQIFFRRQTILDDFEIIKDSNMLQILDTVYDIKNTLKQERQLNPNSDQTSPIIFGSVTDWNLQKMLGAHIFATLLNYYYLKGELRKLGKHLDHVYGQDSEVPSFVNFLEINFETMIQKVLKNQQLLDEQIFNDNVPLWETIIHNFKKVNREIVQVNMFQGLNEMDSDVFAYSAYLKPGLHSIIVYDPIEMLYYKKTIVIEMSKNPQTKIKQQNMLEELKQELERDKTKTSNCFGNWQPDSIEREGHHHHHHHTNSGRVEGGHDHSHQPSYHHDHHHHHHHGEQVQYQVSARVRKAFLNDTVPRNFKPYLFIPDQSDINLCMDHFEDHFIEIKSLYLYLSTTLGDNFSKNEKLNYPFISQNRMKDFLIEIGIMEETLFTEPDEVQETKKLKIKKGKSQKPRKSSTKKKLENEESLSELEIKKNATMMPEVNEENMLSDEPESPDQVDIKRQATLAASKSKHHATIKESQIHEIFHNTNIEYEDDDTNPDDLLNRVELIEFIFRIAVVQRQEVMKRWQKQQNFQRDEVWRNNDQLNVLMNDYILPFEKEHNRSLIDFRDKKLLKSREVSVLLDANFRGISMLYNQYMTKGFEKQFSLQSLQEMLIDSRLSFKFNKDIMPLLFGASKMTVVNEAKESAQYFKLEIVEFQVLLCLMARNYFEDDLGPKGYPLTGETLEIYEHIKSHEVSFSAEMVYFLLRELFLLVDVKCLDFEAIKNQRAFLEGVQI